MIRSRLSLTVHNFLLIHIFKALNHVFLVSILPFNSRAQHRRHRLDRRHNDLIQHVFQRLVKSRVFLLRGNRISQPAFRVDHRRLRVCLCRLVPVLRDNLSAVEVRQLLSASLPVDAASVETAVGGVVACVQHLRDRGFLEPALLDILRELLSLPLR